MSPEGIEIERTYLLNRMPSLPASATAGRIEQGYLPPGDGEAGVVEGRLRRHTSADGTVVCTNTIKEGTGLVRRENERRISPEEFDRHWPRTEGRRLRKTRHLVREGNLVWTIDDFDDLDLVLAEVELPTADTHAPLPDWLVPCIEREVTQEPEYRNYELAHRAGIGKRKLA